MSIFIALLITLGIALLVLSFILLYKGGLFPFGKMNEEELNQCYCEKQKLNKENKNKKK